MKYVYSVNRAGEHPHSFYTSRKKAIHACKCDLICEGFSDAQITITKMSNCSFVDGIDRDSQRHQSWFVYRKLVM